MTKNVPPPSYVEVEHTLPSPSRPPSYSDIIPPEDGDTPNVYTISGNVNNVTLNDINYPQVPPYFPNSQLPNRRPRTARRVRVTTAKETTCRPYKLFISLFLVVVFLTVWIVIILENY